MSGFDLGGEVFTLGSPKAREEIIEGADAGNVARRETAQNRVKRNTMHLPNPIGYADFRANEQVEQVRAKHGCGIARLWPLVVIMWAQQRRQRRKIGDPKFDNKRPIVLVDDEDATGVMQPELVEDKVLIRSMRNKNRFQENHPEFGSKGKITPFRAIIGAIWKCQVISTKK